MEMKEFLDKASSEYYKGTPIISDDEFDRLAKAYSYSSVGYREEGSMPLPYRMYSQQNVFKGEELPLQKYELIESPKLDGAAVALIYVKGRLVSLLKRGDGIYGKDVSHLIPSFPAPQTVEMPNDISLLQISGEVVLPKTIKNARNKAAGALGLNDINEFSSREVSFIAYSVSPQLNDTYIEDLNYLKTQGFDIVTEQSYETYPTDGTIFRVNDNWIFNDLGHTSHHPRGAFALKEQKKGVVTTLKDCIWQVGKSGVVSPVAILEPVVIDGATVSRATLHNIAYIRGLDLEIGCKVEVIRSGGVIPRIVSRVYENNS